MKRAALLSVSDRTGLAEFAKSLSASGYVLLATSGTTKFLSEQGIETLPIEQYTGQKEILDGRVKTLHPKIHAGILARRDTKEHIAELEREGIFPIDVVAVNLYPFLNYVRGEARTDPFRMIELVDVGGPTMIRAAAKNFLGVFSVIDPADYNSVASCISDGNVNWEETRDFRRSLAVKVFSHVARYDLEISRYFSRVDLSDLAQVVRPEEEASIGGTVLSEVFPLRYGENPHQSAKFFVPLGEKLNWEQLSGKTLSYNNLLDFDAALKSVQALPGETPSAVIIKHLNPCGAAQGKNLLEALQRAKKSDPRSHFGGILAFNSEVTVDVAEEIREDFSEIVVAPKYTPDALTLLQKNKNLRVIRYSSPSVRNEFRSAADGILVQSCDTVSLALDKSMVVSKQNPTAQEMKDLGLAWALAAHTRSNAITLVKDGMLIGSGAGQMSRIDSVEIAIAKAIRHKHDLHGAVAASDAFFPFTDNVEVLADAGIRAVVTVKGAKKDEEVIDTANKKGIAMLFASERHFRH